MVSSISCDPTIERKSIKEEDRNIIEKKTPFLNFDLQDFYDLYKLIKSRFNPFSSWKKQATLNPLVGNDDENGLGFGWSIDLDGKYAIIGEYGAAYVFKRIGSWWYEQAVLTVSDGDKYDFFGYSVAIDGEYALIGSATWLNEDTTGSAYVFKRIGTRWAEQAKLTASDGEVNDGFGCSVALDGEYALIGAQGDDSFISNDTGAAYVFKRVGGNWYEQAKLTASDRYLSVIPDGELVFGDNFGCSVALDGEYALIGAQGDDSFNGLDAGAAYVFKREGEKWRQQQKITASKGSFFRHDGDYFGCSVALDGEYGVIGAYAEHINWFKPAGAAYVFTQNDGKWYEQDRLIALDGKRFGFSVDIDGDYVIIGASDSENFLRLPYDGAAYIFKKSGSKWVKKEKIFTNHNIGWSVAIDEKYAIIGAWNDDLAFVYSQTSIFPFIKSLLQRN